MHDEIDLKLHTPSIPNSTKGREVQDGRSAGTVKMKRAE